MSARAMSWLTVALAVSVVSAIGAVVGLMFLFQGFVVSGRPALTERQQALIVPPAPHLQVQPHADLRELRTREEDLLDRYAWLGADHSRARIPIDRAMTLAVGRSLDAGP